MTEDKRQQDEYKHARAVGFTIMALLFVGVLFVAWLVLG